MSMIKRVVHICLTVSADTSDEVRPKLLEFYQGTLGMNARALPSNDPDFFTHEQSLEALAPFGDKLVLKEGEQFHSTVHFLSGHDGNAKSGLVDFITFHTPPQNVQAPGAFNEAGIRSMALLVDNLAAVYERCVAQGVQFLSEPVAIDMGELGVRQFVVAKDPAGNPVEFIEEAEPSGEGKVVRIFADNANTLNIDAALDLYVDTLGMHVAHTVEWQASAEVATAFAHPTPISAKTYYLLGSDPEGSTYFAITDWLDPGVASPSQPAGLDNSYYRMLLETHSIAETQTTVYEATKDKVAYLAPPGVLKSPRGLGSTCLGIFEFDGLVQEVGFVG